MKVWNKVQLAIILVFVALGSYVFISPYLIKNPGVTVVSVSNPECKNVRIGDVITEAGGNQIRVIDDFNSLKFQPKQFVAIVVNAGPGACTALSDGTIGINAKEITTRGITFGVDLVGGTKYTINTSSIAANDLKNVSRILSVRTSYLGLTGTKATVENGKLEIITGKETSVNQLLFKGYLEGRIEEVVVFKNDAGYLMVGNNNYTVKKIGENFLINNGTYSLGDSFYLKDVKTYIANSTNTSLILSLTVFNNSDILSEVPGYSQVGLDKTSGNYNFNVLISLSPAGGRRFNEITQNIKTIVYGSQLNLDAALVFNLDGNDLSRLGIPASIKGQDLATLYIIVSDPSQESLLNKKSLLEATINSGSLPSALSVLSSEEVAATEKNNLLPSLGIVAFLITIVPMVLGGKFKKFKHNSLSILIGFAEIFSVVAIFALLQILYKLNSAFDFGALAGVVLLSVNWAINVASINLSTHKQLNIALKIKYRKIVSLTGISKILLLVVAVALASYGYGSIGIVVFVGVFLDILLFRPFYKSFVS